MCYINVLFLLLPPPPPTPSIIPISPHVFTLHSLRAELSDLRRLCAWILNHHRWYVAVVRIHPSCSGLSVCFANSDKPIISPAACDTQPLILRTGMITLIACSVIMVMALDLKLNLADDSAGVAGSMRKPYMWHFKFVWSDANWSTNPNVCFWCRENGLIPRNCCQLMFCE